MGDRGEAIDTHAVDAVDPVAAHNEMEGHYAAKHAALIRRLVGG